MQFQRESPLFTAHCTINCIAKSTKSVTTCQKFEISDKMSFHGKRKANEKVKPQSPPAPEDYVGVPSTSSSYLPKGPVGRHQLPPEDLIPPPIVNVNVSTSPATAVMTRPFTGPHVVTSLHSTIPSRSASSATSRSMAPAARRTPTIVNVKPTGMCTSSPSPPISVTVPPAIVPTKSGVINGGNGPIIGVTTVPKSPVRAQSFAAQVSYKAALTTHYVTLLIAKYAFYMFPRPSSKRRFFPYSSRSNLLQITIRI
uniref:Neogenin_C domain-containing protein n=1 Tax=Panagrellus redivivus TaxID=6233 RepID=A0A7E4V481_PANRE